MSLPPNMNMPPVPRDAQEASFSEMIPLRSTKIKIAKSYLLWIALAAALLGVLGFRLLDDMDSAKASGDQNAYFTAFIHVEAYTVFVLLVMICGLLYFYAKPRVSLWVCTVAFLFTIGWMVGGPFGFYYDFFDHILPGRMPIGNESPGPLPIAFMHAFFGPGCREELTKAVIVLLCAGLSFLVMRKPQLARNKLIRAFRVTGPLDAIMLAIFSGAAFILVETAGQYALTTANRGFQETGDFSYGVAAGLALVVPRTVNLLAGHIGYSTIFAYFIGLAVIRPKSAWKLIGIGYVTSAALHGAWDSFPGIIASPNVVYSFLGILITVIAVGMLLKARQLESLITGKVAETTGSILVERPVPMMPAGGMPPRPMGYAPAAQGGYPAAPQGGYPPPPQGGYAPPPRPGYAPPPGHAPLAPGGHVPPAPGYAPAPQGGFPAPGFAPAPAQPAPPVAAAPAPAVAQASTPPGPLALDVGGLKLPLRGGETLDLASQPALAGRGTGVQGLIVPHPTRANVFGLKNTGAKPWIATLRDGSTQSIEGDKNIRLAAGVRIDFGDGLVGAVVPA